MSGGAAPTRSSTTTRWSPLTRAGRSRYKYSFDGDQLTLDMVDDQCVDGGVGELIVQTVLYESAPFTLESPAESDVTAESPATYVSTSFVVPFEVTLPGWVAPEPAAELPNFVTWEGSEVDRGIRFLVPSTCTHPAHVADRAAGRLPRLPARPGRTRRNLRGRRRDDGRWPAGDGR